MDSDLFIGIDASTTGVKAIAFDRNGSNVGEARRSIPLLNPEPLGYEQDALDWWDACLGALTVLSTRISMARVKALAISNQRETTVVTTKEGIPTHPALVWMDERCRSVVERVRQTQDVEALHRISGKPVCTTPSIYKLMWLRERRPDVFRAGFRVCDVHAFLVEKLTGEFCSSTAAADPTGLVDLQNGCWSATLLGLAGFGEANLPRLVDPGHAIGTITTEVAATTGLPEDLVVVAGAGDGQAAGLGAGILEPGPAYLNLGTALVSGVHSGTPTIDLAFRTLFGAQPSSYFLETDLKGGTFTLDWLVERFGDGRPKDEQLAGLEQEAANLPPGSEGLLLVPYWCGVMNPHWDDLASGTIVGLRGHHGRTHLYRAILEGLAFEQRLHSEAVEAATGSPITEFVVVGGGARSDLWCQIIADITGKPIQRLVETEASALGAAILAAVGSGAFSSCSEAVAAMSSRAGRFEPGSCGPQYDGLFSVYQGLYESTKSAMSALSEF